MQQLHPSQLSAAVSGSGFVLVDFFTDYCQPCKQMPAILSEVERETGARAYSVNAMHDERLATNLGVRSVPTVIVYKNGLELQRVAGVVPASVFIEIIEAAS